jgi:hypothetical protein
MQYALATNFEGATQPTKQIQVPLDTSQPILLCSLLAGGCDATLEAIAQEFLVDPTAQEGETAD